MPEYTARDAERALRLFLIEVDQGCEGDTIDTWPLEEWVADGPGRFVHLGDEWVATGRPECVVQFDGGVASVFLDDVGSADVI